MPKTKIAILGSTGSIGKTLLQIIEKEKKKFDIILLSADKNHNDLLKQARKFNVKNLIITNNHSFEILKDKTKNSNICVYNNYAKLDKIFRSKIDYTMSSITGIDGLYPTIKIIRFTKKIAIANKESIICGWAIISRELKKNNTEFIPVDSEHFSLWYGIKGNNKNNIEKIFITASGGPFYKLPLKNFKNIKIKNALNHPNWKMGKKISIDSATMINKIYEVIEAKNIFEIPYKKIHILIHPKSYIHAIIKFKNGLIKIIAHDTTMKIPIFNTIYSNKDKSIKSDKLNINLLNNLNLRQIDTKRYPIIKLLKLIPKEHTLFDTVIVSTNDILVELFLKKRIKFIDIEKKLLHVIKSKEFLKYKNIYPRNTKDIINLNKYVRLKVLENMYKSGHV
ncbi:1-deoxy-D-xylulose-5-phosphate reductoisomerase [Candidatus Pelagibacter sp.]|nr:1-deoxy-D-xylulose-5-phosphate reductoisomerase [Candidatus Pelagibacter sp.]